MSGDLRRTRKPTAAIAALFLVTLTIAACAAYHQQHAAMRRGAAAIAAEPSAPAPLPATAPAAEFNALPQPAQRAQVRGEVEAAKASLERDGHYRCCVRPTCNECLLKRGECRCRDVAAKGGPCCGECTEAWLQGHGTVEGLDALELLRRKVTMLDQPDPQ
jgi:hypothetical protein